MDELIMPNSFFDEKKVNTKFDSFMNNKKCS